MSQATLADRPYVNSNLFSGHYLDTRLRERDEWDCDDAASEAMADLQELYDLEGDLVAGYGEDALIDNWIGEVLEILGFGSQEEVTLPDGGGFVDELLFETPGDRRDAAKVFLDSEDTTDLFERGIGLVEAKQWDADFTRRFSEQRPYRNASHQIKHYLENTPANIQWGVLTNGRKWRLYGTNNYETQTYYEVDLPELLERGDLEAFKYFYVLFRPEAFHESGGTTFLDEVWSESETASQELGEDLQDNVFTALRVLGRGFVETNDDLDIDPDDDEALAELKEQSLVLLYRLMFVLYAEARGLIHPEDRDAQDHYDENFSLDELREEVHEEIGEVDAGFAAEYSEYSTSMWTRLENLFTLIDEGEEDLGIPPYNGGLFNDDEHAFLTEHAVSDRYLAEVIYRLSTVRNDEGRYVLADYADLDTRHLGSVYEGLLEHQFRIAPEEYAAVSEDGGQVWKPATEVSVADAVETVDEGGLYVVNDEGERKATGSYYTPDYVVTYIVEETVGPLVEEIREDLIDQGFEPGTQEYLGPFLRRVTDLRILDPAMGSGHFLTKATGYLSEQVMNEVREAESELPAAFDEQHIRREITKECIYGVDLNGMAVELAKLSMWLETLAADRPLAFLDHHFKQGNSLVGSDIEAIEELESDASADDDSQASLAEFGATREGTIERLMDIYAEFLAIENETVEDVHEMKRKYAEIEQDDLRKRLVAMANVHTAERFDVDVPGGAYERMAKALEDDDEWAEVEETDWFEAAQGLADTEDFYHWKLEFPEVFYQQDGTKREKSGFDVVLGNPPYVESKQLPTERKQMLSRFFKSPTGKFDLYIPFTELGIRITSGKVGYITPSMFTMREYGEGLRDYITKQTRVRKFVDFEDDQVFEGATNFTCIFILDSNWEGDVQYVNLPKRDYPPDRLMDIQEEDPVNFPQKDLTSAPWSFPSIKELNTLKSIRDQSYNLSNLTKNISIGIQSGKNDVYLIEEEEFQERDLEPEIWPRLVRGRHIPKWRQPDPKTRVFYPYEENNTVIPEQSLKEDYPATFNYLSENRDELKGRDYFENSNKNWYELWCPRDINLFSTAPKILVPQIAAENTFCIDKKGIFFNTKVYGLILKSDSAYEVTNLLPILNSKILDFEYKQRSVPKRGGFYEYVTNLLVDLPIPEITDVDLSKDLLKDIDVKYRDKSVSYILNSITEEIINLSEDRHSINLSLFDYLGTYSEGNNLAEIDTYQPPKGVGDTKLTATSEDYENIRVGTVGTERESEDTVVIYATARYKPDDEDAHETDQWGYTETEPIPAMRLTDLTETEAALVEAFVPVAVDEAGGFANFRETATKTNSLVDRLEALTLPEPDDVADGLERYIEAKERAEELDEKIERTDELIDEIVYELYGLTDEEIEIVESAVGE